jgi:hypothetical protein
MLYSRQNQAVRVDLSNGKVVSTTNDTQERIKASRAQYYENNKEAVKLRVAEYRKENKETVKACNIRWCGANKDKTNIAATQWRLRNPTHGAQWRKNNPDKVANNVSDRKFKLERATPLWSEAEEIKLVYLKRDEYKKLYGILFEVDHIIPIDSDYVCGLHVLANLQLLDKPLNSGKRNKFQTDW